MKCGAILTYTTPRCRHISFMLRSIAILLLASFLMACSRSVENTASNAAEPKSDNTSIHSAMKRVEPFFRPMGKPAKYDWLGSHNEKGQTFDEYIGENPTKPTAERGKIYVLPIGTFTNQQNEVIKATTGYLEAFYGLPASLMRARAFSGPPNPKDSRYGRNAARQVRTGYFLNDLLPKLLPADAAALIAFTTEDLYPDESMNYVFGQASFEKRVGVWSLFRLKDKTDYGTFLRRTIKVATHETGHMFSMRHCIKYECLMSGTNNLAETDRRPIDACPECSAKIWWFSNEAPAARYTRLADYCRRNGLEAEADEFARKASAVK